MKKKFSLRTQVFGMTALLLCLQSLSMLFALGGSQVFHMLDAEAVRLIDSTTINRAQSYNVSAGQMVGYMAQQATALGQTLDSIAAGAGKGANEIYLDDSLYLRASSASAQAVVNILENHTVSGAFVILNGSNMNKESAAVRSAVYIRNSAPSNALDNIEHYQLELGPIALAQELGIATSIQWGLDYAIPDAAQEDFAFYTNPIRAAAEIPFAEMERYACWTPSVDLFDDGQKDVVFSLPLIDAKGKPYGVIGFEISKTLFYQHYLPNEKLPYTSSFMAIVPAAEKQGALDWFIASNPIAQIYLDQVDAINLRFAPATGLWVTSLPGLGEMYCSVQTLDIYSKNSPFYEDGWSLVSFVPGDVLHETSASVRSVLVTSIVGTTLFSFVAIFFLVYFLTRRISGLSTYVKGLSGIHADLRFKETGIREIDELTAAVETLNRSVISASKTTSKILELTLLPIGGYEISSDLNHVVLTEYIYRLLAIPPGGAMSKQEWERHRAALIASPAIGYDDTYQYGNQIDEMRWLRILEAPTSSGTVGVILDVTEDVNEHVRLAHEVNHDALTQLLNRTAFKREAYARMNVQRDKIGVMIFADLDNLKYLNDTFGHEIGDRLIVRASEMFRSFEQLGGIAARISGDEFAMYLHGFDSKEEAREKIYQQFRAMESFTLVTPKDQAQRIRFSAGLAFYPFDSGDIADLLKLADFAMYEAKHNQKGAVFEFCKQSYENQSNLLDHSEAINRLLDEGLIRFALQPIVSLETGEIYGYEALMRSLLENFKSPLEILKVATAQSKLSALERLVMRTAFEYAYEHREELGERKLFVNSIPSQILSGEELDRLAEDHREIYGNIVIEITETDNEEAERLEKKKELIRRNQMSLAVDDYGSGHSNEVRVMAINPDILKIDMELISDIDENTDKQMLVSNVVAFCHAKGIKVVAEGVERREELAALSRLGVDFVQGYYLAKPQFEFSSLSPAQKQEILDLRSE